MFYSGDHRRIYSYITQWKTERVCEYVDGYRERVRAREKIYHAKDNKERRQTRRRRLPTERTNETWAKTSLNALLPNTITICKLHLHYIKQPYKKRILGHGSVISFFSLIQTSRKQKKCTLLQEEAVLGSKNIVS